MRKYYYYTYKGDKVYGMGVVYSDNSCFPISKITESLREKTEFLQLWTFGMRFLLMSMRRCLN